MKEKDIIHGLSTGRKCILTVCMACHKNQSAQLLRTQQKREFLVQSPPSIQYLILILQSSRPFHHQGLVQFFRFSLVRLFRCVKLVHHIAYNIWVLTRHPSPKEVFETNCFHPSSLQSYTSFCINFSRSGQFQQAFAVGRFRIQRAKTDRNGQK